MIYDLQEAQETKDGWFVGVRNNVFLYLRKDLSVQDSTGYGKTSNDGYWETKTDANIARARYYLKMIEEKQSQPTKEDFIVAYNFGKLLVEQRMDTWTFKLFGLHFTSNKNRKTPYGFNSKTWMIQDLSVMNKLKLILTGKMHRIK